MKQHTLAPESENLKRVTARRIEESERRRFGALLEQKRYLYSARLVGRTLRYVAEAVAHQMAAARSQAPSGCRGRDQEA